MLQASKEGIGIGIGIRDRRRINSAAKSEGLAGALQSGA